jgi:transcription termination/antitermination protein NusG
LEVKAINPEQQAWFVLQTRSQHEGRVEQALKRQGLEIFLPRIIVPSRRRDRKILLKSPLFPGYLFILSNLEYPPGPEILKTTGAVRLLGINGKAVPVPQERIESIKAIVENAQPYYPWPYLESGRQVRIAEGPLTGVVGTIIKRQEKKRRLVVSVDLFRRSLAVELEEEAVEFWQ